MHRPQGPEPYLYPATRTPEPEGGATVVFRDLPEAISYGNDDEDVMAMAREVLELAVAERMDRGEEVPAASASEPGDLLVRLRPLLAVKAALHNALKRSQTTKSDLARRLDVDEAVVRRMFGVDLNPVALELAEVSLWLNGIHRDGHVPWFGFQLTCGNSLVGARRQTYPRHARQAEEGGPAQRVPWRSANGEAPMRPPGTVYHFLLPDPGVASYRDKAAKRLEPANIAKFVEENEARFDANA